MSRKWTLLSQSIIFLALFFWSITCFSQIVGGLAVDVNTFQGARVKVVFNTVDEIQGGITVPYRTILGLTLSDPNGAAVDNFQEMYLYVSTSNNTITSLDGSSTIPLNRLEITCTPMNGFAVPIGGTEVFSPTVQLSAANSKVLLLESERPTTEAIAFNTHMVQIEYSIGVSNSIPTVSPGLYYITLDFDLQACGTWGGVCPDP